MSEEVILVDEEDNELGTEEKIKAHEEAKLHRAFSVFIFNSKGELLLQRRASTKYHSPNLWSNTCCSHPRPSENVEDAAHRRLKEEMGFDCDIKELLSFTYKVEFDNGLYEHEFDHVFTGTYDEDPTPNTEEVDGFKWIAVKELKKDIQENPDNYTHWFKVVLNKVI